MKKSLLLSALLTTTFGLWTLNSSAQVCFNSVTNFSADNGSYFVVNADFNGDGKTDLATANFNANTVSVLLGNGTGSFGAATNLGVGNVPSGLATADFNADGKADLAVTNQNDNNVSILLGNGTGGFGAAVNFATGTGPRAVTAVDFNGDGKKDLAVANITSNDVSVLLGNGNGTFQAAVSYSTGSGPRLVSTSDFNGDGKVDIVTPNYNANSISVLLGNGNGTFQSALNAAVGTNPRSITVADFNSDAKKDLAVANNGSNNVSVLLGNGNGTFQSAVNFSAGTNPGSITNADFSGDGELDLAVANFGSNNVSMLMGSGTGSFGAAMNFAVGTGPYSILNYDFNGDGKMDVATANFTGSNVSVLLNTNLPQVAVNASATTVCPGTSVVLTGTGAGLSYTKTYDIRVSDLISAGYNSCSGIERMLYSQNVGFNWTSTEPVGTIITSVAIQSNMPLDWNGGSHTGLLNGNNIGSQNLGGTTSGWCNTIPIYNVYNYSTTNSAAYVVNGSNQFVMTHTGSWWGFYPDHNLSAAMDVYARVTVVYGAAYAWSGGVVNGVAFVPGSTGSYTVTGTTMGGCSNSASATITVLPAISNVLNTTDASCICNGAADVTASGGTGAFTYLWSNGNTTTAVSALCAADYTITTTDAKGCKKATTTTIGSAPATNLATNSTDASCLCNGTADVTVTGGTGPYTYAWSNGATTTALTGLCAGSYTITATDSYSVACANSVVVTVADNPTLSFSAIKTNATCTASCNGTADVTVSGGTGPYTYAWAPAGGTTSAATGLCAGTTYTLTATDNNGCTNIGSTVAIGVTPMALSFVNTNANCSTSCNGTSTASIVGGSAPYTYAWSNGSTNATATGLCGGNTYTLTVTSAGGCTQKSTVVIASNPIASITSFSNTSASCNAVCNGTSMVSATGGNGAYTYAWAPTGGTNATATGLCYGTTYTATVRDANGCSVASTTTVSLNSNQLDVDWIDVTDASCNGVCNGEAIAYVLGGGGSYSYAWSPSGGTNMTATGLCGTYTGKTYTVIVTDAVGCKDTASEYVYIDNPMNINFATTGVHCVASCNGIAAVSSVSGGNSPYSYLWSNGSTSTSITGLCAGTYSAVVTVTDSVGCKSTEDVTISNLNNGVQTDGFDYWNTFCNSSCSGSAVGYIDQNASNGPYTYMWSTGATTTTVSNLCAGTYTFSVKDEFGCTDWDDVTIYTNSSLSYSITDIESSCDQVCNGKAIVGAVSGGAGPYKYSWFPSGGTNATATGLCGNYSNGIDYTVTVTDVNGCTKTNTTTIYSDYYVYAGTDAWDASCNGVCDGKDSVQGYYGTPPYTYLWSTGATTNVITGLCGDYNNGITYSVTVTDSVGCKAWNDDDIYTDTPPTASITTTHVYCNGNCNGTASAVVSYGLPPYTYTWSTGATTAAISNLCAGPYGLTVKDAKGCMSTSTFNIYSYGSSIYVSIAGTDATCKTACDGKATASGSGGAAPYMYAWAPSGGSAAMATGLCAGTYTVTVTDVNGCSNLSTVTIDQPAALVANVTVTNPTSCLDGDGTATANVTGGTAPYTFVWTPTGQITQTAVTLANGSYSVSIVDANGCTASGTGSVTCTSGINEVAAANMFSVSPNPTIGNLIVTAASGVSMDQITIDNVLGQSVFTTTNSKHQSAIRVDITSQPAGIYLLSVKANGEVYTQKIIKH